MPRYAIANDVINSVALEIGLNPEVDPYGSNDDSFVQLRGLLNAAGQELVEYWPWQFLKSVYEFTTSLPNNGEYDLPDDFCYMIDQTGWDRSNNLPLGGPLSSQDWTCLLGRDLATSTIYASFRQWDGKLQLFPIPAPDGLDISFEYVSRNWVGVTGSAEFTKDAAEQGTDIIAYEPILIKKFLKAKFLEAKGFDSSGAKMDFENMFNSRTGKDTGAPILSASNRSAFPYLDVYRNVGDSGYGLP